MEPIPAILLSGVNLILWTAVALASARDWRRFHDDRAARGVLLSLVLVAAAVGGIISATGYYINVTTGGSSQLLAGLANVVRGAMIVGGFAYVASLHRRGGGKA